MNDQEIIRSRYSKGEIIEVIHGVASLMGARRKKAFFSSETKKIYFQISFLEQQFDTINEKLRTLGETIRKTEETARGPADTLLNFRAARKTLQNEYIRVQAIEKKSRQVVNEKNMSRIVSLTEEINLYENQTIGFAENQLQDSEASFEGLRLQKEDLVAKLEQVWAEFRKALSAAQRQRESAQDHTTDLEALTTELARELKTKLSPEELELKEELKILDQQRSKLVLDNLGLARELELLQATKRKVDKLDDPEAYMDQLRKNLEEDKLSTEAKGDVLSAVTAIIKEVDEINHILSDTISECRQGMDEFEKSLASLNEEGQVPQS